MLPICQCVCARSRRRVCASMYAERGMEPFQCMLVQQNFVPRWSRSNLSSLLWSMASFSCTRVSLRVKQRCLSSTPFIASDQAESVCSSQGLQPLCNAFCGERERCRSATTVSSSSCCSALSTDACTNIRQRRAWQLLIKPVMHSERGCAGRDL